MLLPPVTDAVRLELVETRAFGGRAVYERYRVARRIVVFSSGRPVVRPSRAPGVPSRT